MCERPESTFGCPCGHQTGQFQRHCQRKWKKGWRGGNWVRMQARPMQTTCLLFSNDHSKWWPKFWPQPGKHAWLGNHELQPRIRRWWRGKKTAIKDGVGSTLHAGAQIILPQAWQKTWHKYAKNGTETMGKFTGIQLWPTSGQCTHFFLVPDRNLQTCTSPGSRPKRCTQRWPARGYHQRSRNYTSRHQHVFIIPKAESPTSLAFRCYEHVNHVSQAWDHCIYAWWRWWWQEAVVVVVVLMMMVVGGCGSGDGDGWL